MLTGGAFGYLGDYCLWLALYLSLLVHTWCFFRFFQKKRNRRPNGELRTANSERRERPGSQSAAHGRHGGRAVSNRLETGFTPWPRVVIGNLLILACMLGTCALAAETHLRFVAVDTDAFGMSLPARRWFALHVKLNSLDCRDPEWSLEKPPGTRRIAFVGDSFTYGWGIERPAERFADRIAVRFELIAPGRTEVWNVAKPGADTTEQLGVIRDLGTVYSVDEVVLCYVPNDIEKLLPIREEFDPTKPPEMRLFNPDSSCLIDYLFRRLYVPHVPTVRNYHDWLAGGYADGAVWGRQQEQLGAIIGSCREQHMTLRVVLLPFIRTGGKKYDAKAVHAQLAEFFQTNGIQVVDLLPAIAGRSPDKLVVSTHDPHPNEKAHAVFAEAIWQALYGGANQ